MWSNTPSPYVPRHFVNLRFYRDCVCVYGGHLNQGKPPCTSKAEVLLEELLAFKFRTVLRSRTGLLECDDRAAWLRRNTSGGYFRRGRPFVNIELFCSKKCGEYFGTGFYAVIFEDLGVARDSTSCFEFLARNCGQEFSLGKSRTNISCRNHKGRKR